MLYPLFLCHPSQRSALRHLVLLRSSQRASFSGLLPSLMKVSVSVATDVGNLPRHLRVSIGLQICFSFLTSWLTSRTAQSSLSASRLTSKLLCLCLQPYCQPPDHLRPCCRPKPLSLTLLSNKPPKQVEWQVLDLCALIWILVLLIFLHFHTLMGNYLCLEVIPAAPVHASEIK